MLEVVEGPGQAQRDVVLPPGDGEEVGEPDVGLGEIVVLGEELGAHPEGPAVAGVVDAAEDLDLDLGKGGGRRGPVAAVMETHVELVGHPLTEVAEVLQRGGVAQGLPVDGVGGELVALEGGAVGAVVVPGPGEDVPERQAAAVAEGPVQATEEVGQLLLQGVRPRLADVEAELLLEGVRHVLHGLGGDPDQRGIVPVEVVAGGRLAAALELGGEEEVGPVPEDGTAHRGADQAPVDPGGLHRSGGKDQVPDEDLVPGDTHHPPEPLVGPGPGHGVEDAADEPRHAHVEGGHQDLVLGHGIDGDELAPGLPARDAPGGEAEDVLVQDPVDEEGVVPVVLARHREAASLGGPDQGREDGELHDVPGQDRHRLHDVLVQEGGRTHLPGIEDLRPFRLHLETLDLDGLGLQRDAEGRRLPHLELDPLLPVLPGPEVLHGQSVGTPGLEEEEEEVPVLVRPRHPLEAGPLVTDGHRRLGHRTAPRGRHLPPDGGGGPGLGRQIVGEGEDRQNGYQKGEGVPERSGHEASEGRRVGGAGPKMTGRRHSATRTRGGPRMLAPL